MPGRSRLPAALAVGVTVALGVSAWHPKDSTTWFLETVWVVGGLPLLILLHKRFPLSDLLYCLLAVHALVLMTGGHYTYAEVPAGDWIRDWLNWSRNPYDRFGHLIQGFVPAILVRELLVRTSPLQRSRWLAPLTVCACLAFSAVFEMLEWLSAVIGKDAADAFLGTQGDVWDTQWDMFCCLVGATVSLLLLSRVHNRFLARLQPADTTVSSERRRRTAPSWTECGYGGV
ncbi:DUF2238 domain-containing protein [Streptomyces sp. NPDC002817]|uniref:DUF2238 domain-containing protein n=1 Tax=Streptomyces sp. NPDC088357 TaxID=3154655 RepID=UPI0034443F13